MPSSVCSYDIQMPPVGLADQIIDEKRNLQYLHRQYKPLKARHDNLCNHLYRGRGFIQTLKINIIGFLFVLGDEEFIEAVRRSFVKDRLRRNRKKMLELEDMIVIVETNIILLEDALYKEKKGLRPPGLDYVAGLRE